MIKVKRWFVLLLVFGAFLSFSFVSNGIEKISFKMIAKTLKDKKSISSSGTVYYKNAGGVMVTHLTLPFDFVIISNSKGEYKMYDVKNNSISQTQGADYSTENSFIYQFLNGKTQDMGLPQSGYKIKSTKVEDKMVITTWSAPVELSNTISKAELVHENYKPIYLAFYNLKNKPTQKVYYTNYQKIGEKTIPLNITEIQYLTEKDSVITKRWYSDIKVNNEVDESYLNFVIPKDAKIVR